MTKKRPRFFSKVQETLRNTDNSFANRSDLNDVTKIRSLEQKMENIIGSSDFNYNSGKIIARKNSKLNLKHTKRF